MIPRCQFLKEPTPGDPTVPTPRMNPLEAQPTQSRRCETRAGWQGRSGRARTLPVFPRLRGIVTGRALGLVVLLRSTTKVQVPGGSRAQKKKKRTDNKEKTTRQREVHRRVRRCVCACARVRASCAGVRNEQGTLTGTWCRAHGKSTGAISGIEQESQGRSQLESNSVDQSERCCQQSVTESW